MSTSLDPSHLLQDGRSPEVSAILWAILILCVMTVGYLVMAPEEKQKELKESCDLFTNESLGREPNAVPTPAAQKKTD